MAYKRGKRRTISLKPGMYLRFARHCRSARIPLAWELERVLTEMLDEVGEPVPTPAEVARVLATGEWPSKWRSEGQEKPGPRKRRYSGIMDL